MMVPCGMLDVLSMMARRIRAMPAHIDPIEQDLILDHA